MGRGMLKLCPVDGEVFKSKVESGVWEHCGGAEHSLVGGRGDTFEQMTALMIL